MLLQWSWRQWKKPDISSLVGNVDIFHAPGSIVPPRGKTPLVITVHSMVHRRIARLCPPKYVEQCRSSDGAGLAAAGNAFHAVQLWQHNPLQVRLACVWLFGRACVMVGCGIGKTSYGLAWRIGICAGGTEDSFGLRITEI